MNFEVFLKNVGESLRHFRVKNRMTQAELAEKSGKVATVIARLEGRTSPNVGLRILFEVAQGLPVNLSELFRKAEALTGASSNAFNVNNQAHAEWQRAIARVSELGQMQQEWYANIVNTLLDKPLPTKTTVKTDDMPHL